MSFASFALPAPPPILARAAVIALTEDGIAGYLLADPTAGRLLPVHAGAFCRSALCYPDADPEFEDSLPSTIHRTAASCPRTTVGWVLVTAASGRPVGDLAWIGWPEPPRSPAWQGRLPRLTQAAGDLTAVLYHAPTLAGSLPIVWRTAFGGPVSVVHPSSGETIDVERSVEFYPHRCDPTRIPELVYAACCEQVSR